MYILFQMVTKDPSLLSQLVEGLLKFWPQKHQPQEVFFIAGMYLPIKTTNQCCFFVETQALLEVSSRKEIEEHSQDIFLRVSQAVDSMNYQVPYLFLSIMKTTN